MRIIVTIPSIQFFFFSFTLLLLCTQYNFLLCAQQKFHLDHKDMHWFSQSVEHERMAGKLFEIPKFKPFAVLRFLVSYHQLNRLCRLKYRWICNVYYALTTTNVHIYVYSYVYVHSCVYVCLCSCMCYVPMRVWVGVHVLASAGVLERRDGDKKVGKDEKRKQLLIIKIE